MLLFSCGGAGDDLNIWLLGPFQQKGLVLGELLLYNPALVYF